MCQEQNEVQENPSPLETTLWWTAALGYICEAVGDRPVRRIRCVGLGSFASSQNARTQICVAEMVAKHLRCKNVTVCDPAMQDSDLRLLREWGHGIELDATLKTDLDDTGVDMLFMPFCHVILYELVLRTYIENGLVGNVVLFGNYLTRFTELEAGCGEAIKIMARNRVFCEYCLPPIQRQRNYESLDGLCISKFIQPSGKVYDDCVKEFKKIKETGSEPIDCCPNVRSVNDLQV